MKCATIIAVVLLLGGHGCGTKPAKDRGAGADDGAATPGKTGHGRADTVAGGDTVTGTVSAALGAPPAELAGSVQVVRVATGFARPIDLDYAPGAATGRLFVTEQAGRVRMLSGGKIGATFLDLRSKVTRAENEQGLLGLAFHPGFAENGKLYVNYTNKSGDTRVVEYTVKSDERVAVDTSSARVLLEIDQPWGNHNGGDVRFGPDGKLYVGTGDGGAANDPKGAGQDDTTRLAKLLRIDVDAAEPRVEIVGKGLRNPWRSAFDPETGDLYIADVGQNQWEYVHVVAHDDLDGHNFGWNIMEGTHCFLDDDCDKTGLTPAVVEYPHSEGCSITGGVVYRGKAIPALLGAYFYADFCTTLLRSFRWSPDGVRDHWDWQPIIDADNKLGTVSAFGVDADGEMYIVLLDGDIYHLVPA